MEMLDRLPTIKRLMRQLQQIPFLASKNMYRVTEHFLKFDVGRIEQFCILLQEIKHNVQACEYCLVWHERATGCLFCNDKTRSVQQICVVESWQELLVIERTGYKGLYHILGGIISPLDGIGPNDLSIDLLIKRIQAPVQEVILAMNQTPEGEATAAFIARKLKGFSVIITCLARGVPMGSNLEFLDRMTLTKALADRKPF